MVWLIAKSLTIFLLSVVERQRRCLGKEVISQKLTEQNDFENKVHSFTVEQ